ncbi:MAG TPA: TolC family protein [Candidatus Omnitrophota bacterium]|nr:transporter [Candidatus Omnitrophota bacterium]HRK60979.1 TolC family protein [Candidatus Omnitrophota bacterium]
MKIRFPSGLLIVAAVVAVALISGTEKLFSKEAESLVISNQLPVKSEARHVTAFEDLLEEVSANNPELQFYEAEIEAAKGLRKTAGMWNNPEVSGSVGQKKVTSGDGTDKGVASEVVVTQSLEWPGRIRLRKAIADRDIKVAELGLEQFRALLAARTEMAAYNLVAAREKAAATREVAEHFHALHEVLAQRDQAGLTSVLEARIIEGMELNGHRNAHAATAAYQAALFDLNQLRGMPPESAIALTKIDLEFKPLEKHTDDLMKLARKNDFQVRVRAMELEKQKYGVKLARNERFPAITAGPAISQEQAGERERIIGAQISLPVPLWDRNQGGIQTAKAQQSKAQTIFYLAEREAERRVIEAAAIYKAKLAEMSHWNPEAIQHFKEAAELADRHYRLGSVPVSTYVELQSQYLATIEGLQHTKKEALEAASQLELLTGTDLSLVNIIGEAK